MIHLFCALKCEAAPLVQRLRLRPDPGTRLFRAWTNPAGDLTLTLTDVSDGMLALSRAVNPECEHVEGDLRTVRLGRRGLVREDASVAWLDAQWQGKGQAQ